MELLSFVVFVLALVAILYMLCVVVMHIEYETHSRKDENEQE